MDPPLATTGQQWVLQNRMVYICICMVKDRPHRGAPLHELQIVLLGVVGEADGADQSRRLAVFAARRVRYGGVTMNGIIVVKWYSSV